MSKDAEKITELTRRIKDIDEKLAGLIERRKQLALSAVDGNRASIKSIAEIDDEAEGLRNECETLNAAIERIALLQQESDAEIAKRDREKREAEARKIADDVMTLNAEIDHAMVQLTGLFQRRAKLIHQLGKTNVMPMTIISRMLHRHSLNAGARAAGLQKFIGIDYVSPDLIRPLAKCDGALRGKLAVADSQPKSQEIANAINCREPAQ